MTKDSRAVSTTSLVTVVIWLISRMRSIWVTSLLVRRKLPPVIRVMAATASLKRTGAYSRDSVPRGRAMPYNGRMTQPSRASDGPPQPHWPTCDHEDRSDKPCTGVQIEGASQCWAHVTDEQRDRALSRLRPGSDLDARGTTLTGALLELILDAVRDDNSHPKVGRAGFEGAFFEGSTRFVNVIFEGEARFERATFKGPAWFYEAIIKGDASFEEATLARRSMFDKAIFESHARFDRAIFEGDVRFEKAAFKGFARFYEAMRDLDTNTVAAVSSHMIQ